MKRRVVTPGERFGRLTIVGESVRTSSEGSVWYDVVCDCGARKTVRGSSMFNGLTRSCGCLKREVTLKRTVKHGLARTPEYRAWQSMLDRCRNERDKFKRWNGRGIKVCPEWSGPEGFAAFFAHVGPRPSPDHSIDRKDNDGDYVAGNVRWATRIEQNRNRSTTSALTFDGKTQSIAAWAEETGIPYGTIQSRLRYGWDVPKVLTQPIRRREPEKEMRQSQ